MATRKPHNRTSGQRPRPARAVADTRLALVDLAALDAGRAAPLALRIALPVLVAVAAFVTFLPALDAGFVNWDDDKAVLDNPRIRGFNWQWVFTQSKLGHYHPLTWLSYSIDHAIGAARYDGLAAETQKRYVSGLDPKIFHLHNLILHSAVAVAFYFVARLLLRILLPPSAGRVDWLTPLAACAAALLFACHPLRVENAVWVTERRDVLSAVFLLPCVICYLRYTLTPKWDVQRVAWYSAAVVLLTLSLLSKAWGITLPAVLLLLDYHPLRRLGRAAGWANPRAVMAYLDKIPFVMLAAFFAYKAKMAQASALATMKSLAEWSFADRVMQACYGLFFYTWKTLVPVGLTPLVQLPPESIRNPFSAKFLIAAAAVVAVAALLILRRRRWPAGVILGLVYAGTLSPILGFAQSGPQLVADKYAYIGCLVWPLAAGAGLIWLWRHREEKAWARWAAPGASVLALGLCVTYAALAWSQAGIWHDSHTLWSHAVKVDPQCVLARSNLGMLERQAGNVGAALAHYEAAIAVDPADPILLNNYAYALRQDPSRLAESIEIVRRAVALRPKMPELHFTLANALIDANQLDQAVTELNTCVRLHRDQPRPKYHRALGRIAMMNKDYEAAEREYRRALELELKLDPRGAGVIDAYDRLGWICLSQNRPAEAADWFRRILQIDPGNVPAKRGLERAQNLAG